MARYGRRRGRGLRWEAEAHPKASKDGGELMNASEHGRVLPNVWHQRRAKRVRCMPGLGAAVEAGPDVERGKALGRTREDGPIGAVVGRKECAGEGDEARKLGITKARFVWVGAKAECGRGRTGAKNGARPEREMPTPRPRVKTASDEARRAVCVLLFRWDVSMRSRERRGRARCSG